MGTAENNATTRDLFFRNLLIDRHVGGGSVNEQLDDENKYIRDQLKVIEDGNVNLPPESRLLRTGVTGTSSTIPTEEDVYIRFPKGRYDPYIGFLYNKGLLDDGFQRRRYKSHFVDINSAYRNKQPMITREEGRFLGEDALEFRNGSSLIFVRDPIHNFEIQDPITLENVYSRQSVLRTYRGSEPTFEIPSGCNFMKIFYDHGVPLNYDGDTIKVQFDGILGDRGSTDLNSFLGNIPINILNSIHDLKITLDQDEIVCPKSSFDSSYFAPSADYFFVVLPVAMQMHPSPDVPSYTLLDYNFKLTFLSLAGVPLNVINANYPIDPEHINGYHIIQSVNSEGYTINVSLPAIVNSEGSSATVFNGGGKFMFVSRVSEITPGFPNPNSYDIDLGKTFHDVISIKLLSTEIPYTEKPIRGEPSMRVNNKLFFNDIDDGDFVYEVDVPEGSYTPEQLEDAIEKAFLAVPRKSAGDSTSYTSKHFVRANVDPITNEVTLESFKEFILQRPIIDIEPDVSTDPNVPSDPNQSYVLVINHPNHGMIVPGLTVIVQNAVAHKGIPAEVINGEHLVTEIVDANTYKISLGNFNLLPDRTETGGGTNVFIYVPDLFRLRFDQPGTLGTVLGFRNVGDVTSVTPFSRKISNKDLYEFEVEKNTLGQNVVIKSNALQLNGDRYLLMMMDPVKIISTPGTLKQVFAKILLDGVPGTVLYNSFVPTVQTFINPIHEIFKISVAFYTPDGVLFDFNGVDHSFTLEFITISDIPEGTGINASTGKNYNERVTSLSANLNQFNSNQPYLNQPYPNRSYSFQR